MNPELQRLLWLNISTLRLVLVPAIFGLVLLAAGASMGDKLPHFASVAGAIVFALFTVAGGAYSSSAAVSDERQDDTWDQQRMSALTPWAMTWGKLLGATVFHWYTGLICLVLMAWGMINHGQAWSDTATGLFAAILFAVFAHAINLAASVQFSGTMPRRMLWLLPLILFVVFQSSLRSYVDVNHETTQWWSLELSDRQHLLGTVILATLCGLVASWRAMAQALAVPQWPWGMPALVVLISTYSLGYLQAVDIRGATQTVAGLSLAFAMLSAMTEAHTRSHWQRLINHFKQGRAAKAIKALPVWPVMLVLAASAATVGLATKTPPASAVDWSRMPLHLDWSSVLVIARDCAVALFFAFAPQARRPRLAFLTYLAIAWVIVPWLLIVLTDKALPVQWLIPMAGKSGGSVIAAILHFAAAASLLVWRWKETRPSPETDAAPQGQS
ncbi:hypothetical protein [Hydrogenophaga sp. 5NK40-0174]|uniref:hypothetical protein n=1 Tax=Hydrogenophaga sp. 5NK40-0174 TaxID=3127649 RepID=UPI00310663D2